MQIKIIDDEIIELTSGDKRSVVAFTDTVLGHFINKQKLARVHRDMFGCVNLESQTIEGLTKIVDGRNGDTLGALVDDQD